MSSKYTHIGERGDYLFDELTKPGRIEGPLWWGSDIRISPNDKRRIWEDRLRRFHAERPAPRLMR